MPTEKERKIENWTMTFEGKPVMSYTEEITADFPEYETDRTDYEEYISELKLRIENLKSDIRYLEGKCEAQEKFWKIWNGESED